MEWSKNKPYFKDHVKDRDDPRILYLQENFEIGIFCHKRVIGGLKVCGTTTDTSEIITRKPSNE